MRDKRDDAGRGSRRHRRFRGLLGLPSTLRKSPANSGPRRSDSEQRPAVFRLITAPATRAQILVWRPREWVPVAPAGVLVASSGQNWTEVEQRD